MQFNGREIEYVGLLPYAVSQCVCLLSCLSCLSFAFQSSKPIRLQFDNILSSKHRYTLQSDFMK